MNKQYDLMTIECHPKAGGVKSAQQVAGAILRSAFPGREGFDINAVHGRVTVSTKSLELCRQFQNVKTVVDRILKDYKSHRQVSGYMFHSMHSAK